MKFEIENIIEKLRIRTGIYGEERKNLVNSLFKSVVDLSFPNIVKWLFLESEHEQGIFERLDRENYIKTKRMSKYKKDEVARHDLSIAELLDVTPE